MCFNFSTTYNKTIKFDLLTSYKNSETNGINFFLY